MCSQQNTGATELYWVRIFSCEDTRVSFSFLSKGGGGKMRLHGLLGEQVCICVQSMWQTRGVRGHAPLGNFDFGPFIRCNLVESGTAFAQT